MKVIRLSASRRDDSRGEVRNVRVTRREKMMRYGETVRSWRSQSQDLATKGSPRVSQVSCFGTSQTRSRSLLAIKVTAGQQNEETM